MLPMLDEFNKDLKKKNMVEEVKIQEMIEQAVARAIAPFMKPSQKVLLSREAVSIRLKKDKSTLCR